MYKNRRRRRRHHHHHYQLIAAYPLIIDVARSQHQFRGVCQKFYRKE